MEALLYNCLQVQNALGGMKFFDLKFSREIQIWENISSGFVMFNKPNINEIFQMVPGEWLEMHLAS